jgi:hypothetical protein
MTTSNSIKLKLKNNSRNRLLSSLNNRIYALNTDPCNDYFASCCNCCKNCDCCPCLDGLWITISGVGSLECDCTSFNKRKYVPNKKNYPIQNAPPEFADATCSAGGWALHNLGEVDCPGFSIYLEVSWLLFCDANGELVLLVDVRTVQSNLSESMNLQATFYPTDCDDLFQAGYVSCNDGKAFKDYCDCTNVRIQTEPVFGGPYGAPECQCCKDVRCEESDPSCLNPFPDTLFLTLSDNCAGNIILTLNRSGMCWTGTYVTLCTECSPVEYTVDVTFCCNGGVWTFLAVVVSPDSCADSLCWSTNPDLDLSEGCSPMDKPNCDPITASSETPKQTSKIRP